MVLNFDTHQIDFEIMHTAWEDQELLGKVKIGPPDLSFFKAAKWKVFEWVVKMF